MKLKASSKRWVDRQHRDVYVKKANEEGYRSRAAFKLIEIDEKFKLIKKSKSIVDVGAAPGGWSQVLAERSDDAKIVSVDILNFKPIEKVQQVIGDFEDEKIQEKIIEFCKGKVDLVVSDIAPSTVGHRKSDHLRIMCLVEEVFEFTKNIIKRGGSFAAKIFQGGEEKQFHDSLKKYFKKVCFFKPKSSRKESVEIYIVAIDYIGAENEE